MSPDQHLAFQVVRHAYTAAQEREAEDGTPFDPTPGDLRTEILKRSDQLDEARLKRVLDLLPWATERLRRKLIAAAIS